MWRDLMLFRTYFQVQACCIWKQQDADCYWQTSFINHQQNINLELQGISALVITCSEIMHTQTLWSNPHPPTIPACQFLQLLRFWKEAKVFTCTYLWAGSDRLFKYLVPPVNHYPPTRSEDSQEPSGRLVSITSLLSTRKMSFSTWPPLILDFFHPG